MEAPRYELRDPATEPWQRHAARAMDKIIDRIVWAELPPKFTEPRVDRADQWPELVAAQEKKEIRNVFRYAPDRTPNNSHGGGLGAGKTDRSGAGNRRGCYPPGEERGGGPCTGAGERSLLFLPSLSFPDRPARNRKR